METKVVGTATDRDSPRGGLDRELVVAFEQLDGGWTTVAVVAWLRLPLQVPMFIWAKNSPVKQ